MRSFARPEHELLICLARPTLDITGIERVRRLLQDELDWDYLLAVAERHSVISLLYHHLNSICTSSEYSLQVAGLHRQQAKAWTPNLSEQVSHQALSRLRELNQENTRQSLFLTGELIKLVGLLEAQGVRAVPFKGPTLALTAYGDVSLRQFGDLDVLVQRRDVLKVKELLVREGLKPKPQLTSVQEAALLRFDCAYNFGNDKNVVFDVHWNFAAPYFSLELDVDGIWGRLETTTIAGKQLLTISAEDLLLVLCLHGFTHFWERLGWICDVACLIDRRSDLDWQLVLYNATRQGSRRILSLGLLLASELLEAPIPRDVLRTVKTDTVAKTLAERMVRQLFALEHPVLGLLDGALLQLEMRERKRDKLASCLRLAATPRVYDWMLLPLPGWLFFLYYLLRPLRLAGKYGAKLLRGSNLEA